MKYVFMLLSFLVTQVVLGQGKPTSVARNTTLTNTGTNKIIAVCDAIFQNAYTNSSPGAAILIAKGDTILYRKAFGMANLELNVKMKPETVFQLASITKQFTSVAIMMLVEQGKLSLKDPLSKFISDFSRGNEITVHHLLNHTSGIKSYTNLPEFRTKTRMDMTPAEIVQFFKNLPLEFSPNEKYEYSNSGYLLLGYIIEQISGMTYGEFIQKNIFDKLAMKHSYYADSYKIIPNRASGYQLYEGKYENAEYISTTIPYAAGSLMSTVDDMFLWSKAIRNNLLISENSKRIAFANHSLTNGKPTNYGYGWAINEIAGISTIEHTGGINGFTTSGIYVPDSNIYSIVLTNIDDGKGPESFNIKIVSTLLGKSIKEQSIVHISESEMKKWVGAYQFDDVVRFITYDQGKLYSAREGGRPMQLEPLSNHEFRFKNSLTTYQFSFNNGKKQVLYTDRIHKSRGIETDKKSVAEREAISLPQEILIQYVGVYELQPSFQIQVEVQNGRLIAQASGQPPVELHAETRNSFFIKEIAAQVVFNMKADGSVTDLTFFQAGNSMKGKKIK